MKVQICPICGQENLVENQVCPNCAASTNATIPNRAAFGKELARLKARSQENNPTLNPIDENIEPDIPKTASTQPDLLVTNIPRPPSTTDDAPKTTSTQSDLLVTNIPRPPSTTDDAPKTASTQPDLLVTNIPKPPSTTDDAPKAASTQPDSLVTDDFKIEHPIPSEPDSTESETKHLDNSLSDEDIEFNTGKILLTGTLILTEKNSETQYHISCDDIREITMGRSDPTKGFQPSIDLSSVGGRQYGVSRQHATIARKDHYLVLIDNQSANGTFLNGQRLVPEQPRIIRDHDNITLGQITLTITHIQKSE